MRLGLEEMFKEETKDFFDKNTAYFVRRMRLQRLTQAQEGVVRVQTDGSIASPIDPDDKKDAAEYLERLRKIVIPL